MFLLQTNFLNSFLSGAIAFALQKDNRNIQKKLISDVFLVKMKIFKTTVKCLSIEQKYVHDLA